MQMKLRIRDVREDRDYSQTTIAKIVGCDQSLYSKYERGERDIPLHIVDKLADFYKISVDYLLGRTDEETPYPPAKQK